MNITSNSLISPLVLPVESVIEVIVSPGQWSESRHCLVEVVLVPVSIRLVRVVHDTGRVDVSLSAGDIRRRVQIIIHETRLIKVEHVLQLIAVQNGILVRDISHMQQLSSVAQYDARFEQWHRRWMIHHVFN